MAPAAHLHAHRGLGRDSQCHSHKRRAHHCAHSAVTVESAALCRAVPVKILLTHTWLGFTAEAGMSGAAQWLACWAHNPKVRGPKPPLFFGRRRRDYIAPLTHEWRSLRTPLLSAAVRSHKRHCVNACGPQCLDSAGARASSLTAGVWRNGSASDSRSEGWEFESLCPHFPFQVMSYCGV